MPRGRGRRRVVSVVVALLVLVALLAGGLVGTAWAATPSADGTMARVEAFTRRHGGVMIPPGGVPATLAHALVATEDASFYRNPGIDFEGTGRAVLYDLANRCVCQGGSGITQQLVEDVYFGGDDTSPRKYVEDTTLAIKIDRRLPKAQILAAYFSEVYLGHGAYGAVVASRVYFDRPLDDLTLTRYAMLAGLPRAPTAYDPLVHPAAARARVRQVLAAMVAAGYVTAAQASHAAAGSL
jgi:penicillin-binding protein 1A